MRNLMLIIGLVALAACAPNYTYKEREEGLRASAHLGSVMAQRDESCATDPACVCTLPEQDRPPYLPTPKRLLELFPTLPAVRSYDCDD